MCWNGDYMSIDIFLWVFSIYTGSIIIHVFVYKRVYITLVAVIQFDTLDFIHHICSFSSQCVRTYPCAWDSLYVCVDDLDSRWVNSQVCPSFSGRIRGRWDWAWLDVSRLMSFPSLTSAATAAAWAKLETGTQSWLAFTRLIYIVPQMYHTIMACQRQIKFG